MPELWQNLVDLAPDYALEAIGAGLLTAVGWYFGQRRARSRWARREFFDRVNFSLNMIEDGRLLIRTLMEKSCQDVFLNAVAVNAVLDAARHTKPDDSLLPLSKEDYWYFLNAVLNEVAEKLAEGTLKQDMGRPVEKVTYLVCLTCESAGPMRTRKVRVMVIQKARLLNLPQEIPKLELEHHITRWQTLNQLAAAFAKTPDRFREVEICV